MSTENNNQISNENTRVLYNNYEGTYIHKIGRKQILLTNNPNYAMTFHSFDAAHSIRESIEALDYGIYSSLSIKHHIKALSEWEAKQKERDMK